MTEPVRPNELPLVPLPDESVTRMAFARRQRFEHDTAGHTAAFIRPEDLVVAKLIAFRETQSDKHLRDARGILVTQWGRLDVDADEAHRRLDEAGGVIAHVVGETEQEQAGG